MHTFSRRAARAVAATVLAALTLVGCSSTGGAPRPAADATAQRTDGGLNAGQSDTERAVVAMVSHGAPGDTYWDLVRRGAEDAAAKSNIELRYSSDPQAPNQANLVQSAIDAQVDGIALTLPNADAIGPTAQKAVEAEIPVVALNAGMTEYDRFGIQGFFGQDESVAGEMAGRRLKEEGATGVLCVIHEQGNSSQEARCAGVEEGMGGSGVEILYVNGMDLTNVQSTLTAKLAQDPGIDWIMGLVAPVALTARSSVDAANSAARIATFDTNAQLVDEIAQDEIAFAVDQQPYLQGYLAVDALWLALRNGSTVGGGQPVYTGPAIVDKRNVDVIADAARAGLR